jgi:3-oxoacyl-[acyl-carrier protein] reductase
MTDAGTCVLTGATRGLGRALTAALVQAGYDVVAIARSRDDLDALRDDCPGPGSVRPLVADLSDRAVVDATAETLASLDVAPSALVNNAATQLFKPVEEFSTAEFSDTMHVNTVAPFVLSRAVLPAMTAAGGGLIVNVASDLAYRPHLNGSAYCASKAALVAWSQVFQEEQRRNGIKVSVVEPGWIATGSNASARSERGDMAPEELADAILALLRLPVGVRVDRLVVHPMNQGTWG